ncbi:MAG TPA: hypothetical protein VF975_01665, partial [Thermoanaerobaculia bacterium]
ETPASGETRAFPKMSFEDLEKTAPPAPQPAPPSMPEPLEPPSWGSAPPEPSSSSLWDEQPSPTGETKAFPRMSFDELQKMANEPPAQSSAAEELPFTHEPEPARQEEEPAPPPAAASEAATGELSEDQIDRIARRVVQLMSETVVRNIAWEVIPDLAEMVVKERIRQLESE